MGSAFAQSSLCSYKVETQLAPGFPLIIDDMTLAFHLGIRNKTLWWLVNLRNDETAYNCFGIPEFRPDGSFKKVRKIQEPMPQLKRVHRVLNGIFSEVPMPRPVAAYVRGLKVSDAAAQHLRPSFWFKDGETDPALLAQIKELEDDPRVKKIPRHKDPHDPKSPRGVLYHQPIVAIHLDIQNFFNSIHAAWVRRFFAEKVGYSHYVSTLLATLCTVKQTDLKRPRRLQTPWDKETPKRDSLHYVYRFLPQGSPISGSLANLVGYAMFGETIEAVLAQHSPDWVFTIYSDDIVLSHPDQTITAGEVERMRDTVIRVIEDAGFKINQKKVKIVRSKNDRVKILGCIVNEKLNLPKYVTKNLKSLIYNCTKNGFAKAAETLNLPSDAAVVQYVRGMLQYVKQVRPDLFEKLDTAFQEALACHPVAESHTTIIVDKEDPTRDQDLGAPSERPLPGRPNDLDLFARYAREERRPGGRDGGGAPLPGDAE